MRHPLSVSVKIKLLHDDANMPSFQTEGAAGADLYAYLPNGSIGLAPGEFKKIPCGFAMEFDHGFAALILPRSGLAAKHGITVLNSPGLIDADYRGAVQVILINHGPLTFIINHKERIAQMVMKAIPRTSFIQTDTLSNTERGEGGFGSTGNE